MPALFIVMVCPPILLSGRCTPTSGRQIKRMNAASLNTTTIHSANVRNAATYGRKVLPADNCGYQPKPRGEGIDYIDDHLIEIGQTQRRELDRQTFYAELRGFQATARKKDGSPYK